MSGVSDPLVQPVVSSSRQPLGYRQIATLTASTLLSTAVIPPGSRRALIRTEAQDVRWRDDGVAPTASIGMPLAVGDTLEYTGDLTTIRFIEAAVGAKLNIAFYE